jgi:hypothetical protein
METNKGMTNSNRENHEEESLKGALFSSLVFVGGTIVAFILLFIVLYIGRI